MHDPSAATWNAAELEVNRKRWTFALDDRAQRDLLAALKKARDPDKALLDYRRENFDLGSGWPVINAAFEQAKHGLGVALIKGLPRDGLDEHDFELLTWGIGLHTGVGRPQGKATHYISAVRDAGNADRTGTGRGYNSNAELDFHTDSADMVVLSCYNKAKAGGMSITTSTPAAHARMKQDHPDLLEWLHRPELAHNMWLEPGDLQIINSHTTLHSRTDFTDHDDPARKRLLFRLWLAPPDGDHLPESWRVLYRAVEPGTVRGGIIGQAHDERCKAFERRQALGMRLADG